MGGQRFLNFSLVLRVVLHTTLIWPHKLPLLFSKTNFDSVEDLGQEGPVYFCSHLQSQHSSWSLSVVSESFSTQLSRQTPLILLLT